MDRRSQSIHRFYKFRVLGIQIVFALRFNLVLINSRQIDRPEAINAVANQLQLLFPIDHLGIFGQILEQSFKVSTLLGDLFFNGATQGGDLLGGNTLSFQPATHFLQLFITFAALLFLLAHLVINFFHFRASGIQFALNGES